MTVADEGMTGEGSAGQSRPLYLFGAGPMGRAVARHAAGLPLALSWFDTRPEPEPVAGAARIADEALQGCIDAAPADAALIIMSGRHPLDYALALAALSRPFAYVGMIGSRRKCDRAREQLARDGVSAAAIARLAAPIGLPGIHGPEPDVIAIATLAQVLLLGPAA